jgi:CxxC motif-containing protein (DUF1111 family)
MAACSGGGGGNGGGGGAPLPIDPQLAALGSPIEGLPPAQLAAFERGRELMVKRFKPGDGLGPLYNATSCAACHDKPVVGGSSPRYRNFYIAVFGPPGFQFSLPGLPSPVVPLYGTLTSPEFSLNGGRVVIPESIGGLPVLQLQRNAPPFFGVGLFEFVSDQTIIGLSDPDDLDQDGISGRYNSDPMGNIGRFGYKLQANNIEVFIRGAAQNQMGMTTDPVLGNAAVVSLSSCYRPQAASGQDTPTTDSDGVSDPEIPTADFADIIAFNRFLAPPVPKPFTAAAERGELKFAEIGCTKCHVPEIPSSMGPLRAYTDLLLHDMGPELADGLSQGFPQAGINDPFTTASEFRTQPLWGVALHAPFLHDGRADSLTEAIMMHGGEAQAIRDAFNALLPEERDDIIAFLESL